MELNELKEIVRDTLKNRENWRSDTKGTTKKKRRGKKRTIAKVNSKADKGSGLSQLSGAKIAKPISKKALRMAEGAIKNAILTAYL